MPLWTQVDKSVKVGDVIDDYIVAEIRMMIPMPDLMHNYYISEVWPKESEEKKEYLRQTYPEIYSEPKLKTAKKPYARLVAKE